MAIRREIDDILRHRHKIFYQQSAADTALITLRAEEKVISAKVESLRALLEGVEKKKKMLKYAIGRQTGIIERVMLELPILDASLLPINDFPLDILRHIFVLSTRSTALLHQARRNTSQVCRLWRSVAMSASTFWCDAVTGVTGRFRNTFMQDRQQMHLLTFERAKTASLTIQMDFLTRNRTKNAKTIEQSSWSWH